LPRLADGAGRLLAESDPNHSVIVPTPSLHSDGTIDRLWWALRSKRNHHRLRRLARQPLTAAKFFRGDHSQSWQPCARAAAEAIAREVKIDLCIGEHSPDAGLFLARWFSEKYQVPWLADFRDPILRPIERFARPAYRPIARRLLATASCTVAVNRVEAEIDQRLWGLPSHSIPNGFDPEEFAGPIKCQTNQQLTIAYVGNILEAQRMETFLDGLALLSRELGEEDRSRLRFYYRGGAHQKVAAWSASFGVADMVEVEGLVERSRALALIRQADLLLLLSIDDPDKKDIYLRDGFYPAKTFEYFGARRAIICVPGDGGMLDALIRESQTGVILNTPREVADYLGSRLAEWKRGSAPAYQPNENIVSQFSRRNLTGMLAAILDQTVGKSVAPV
jgi:glycosyltransferase involved in cell wall biosynthesis